MSSSSATSTSVVKSVEPLGFPYQTPDPFLFCVYHRDFYPKGHPDNQNAPVRGNGADFDWSKPYRMYHGKHIPGFPQHPHRGFETLTLVLEGTCDHTDSLGGAGRYGGDGHAGDLQWMTAGSGCVHGENFPLRHTTRDNTLRLFQIWLNLSAKDKLCTPGYLMYWKENAKFIPGENGAEIQVVAGHIGDTQVDKPAPPHSWAADPRNDVGVYYITLPSKGGKYTLPPAQYGNEINRWAYVVEGSTDKHSGIFVGGTEIKNGRGAIVLDASQSCPFENTHTATDAHVLILQGRPLNEPVAQHGPFVMNTQQQISQAFADYQKTRFGGWPWKEDAVIFPRDQERFADMIVDGKKVRELPPSNEGQPTTTASLKQEL